MQPMMKKAQQGFTLIELMIVVAIIGILAAIAIPAYSDYITRAKVSEGLNLAASAKTAVSEYYMVKNAFPTSNTLAGLAAATDINGEHVKSLGVGADGVITVTFSGGDIEDKLMTMTPATTGGGAVKWTCAAGTVAGTKIDQKFLPANCRV